MIEAPHYSPHNFRRCLIHGRGEWKSPCLQQHSLWYQEIEFTPNANCARFCAYSNKKSTYEKFRKCLKLLVPRDRIELPTRGFSVNHPGFL